MINGVNLMSSEHFQNAPFELNMTSQALNSFVQFSLDDETIDAFAALTFTVLTSSFSATIKC